MVTDEELHEIVKDAYLNAKENGSFDAGGSLFQADAETIAEDMMLYGPDECYPSEIFDLSPSDNDAAFEEHKLKVAEVVRKVQKELENE